MTISLNYSISSVSLVCTEIGNAVDAELWGDITEKNLVDWETEWVPETHKITQALHYQGVKRQFWPQSRHWNWQNKRSDIEEAKSSFRSFSIVCDGMTQAMMIVDKARRAKIKSQNNNHLIYIEYIEVAPWNRGELRNQTPKYKGAGSVLIRATIELSEKEGFNGRIGLHSLPQADEFYLKKCGMTDLGKDIKYDNLRYFEMTPEQANALVHRWSKM